MVLHKSRVLTFTALDWIFFRSAVRLCCPQGGVFTNVLTFLFEVFIMAPCLACKWASGKGKQPPNWTTGSKPRYGGTDDVELGDKWPLIARTKYLNISRLKCTVLFLAKYLFLGLWLYILLCWNCDASSSLIDFWREKRDFRKHIEALGFVLYELEMCFALRRFSC